jgi:hypothetical protein
MWNFTAVKTWNVIRDLIIHKAESHYMLSFTIAEDYK